MLVIHICDLYIQGTSNSDVSYLATGDQVALKYFDVDSTSGNVSVKTSLLVDEQHREKYMVSPTS